MRRQRRGRIRRTETVARRAYRGANFLATLGGGLVLPRTGLLGYWPKSNGLVDIIGLLSTPPAVPAYTDYLSSVYPEPATGSVYYVRADGTAATLAAATNPATAAGAMATAKLADRVFLEGLLPGDKVVFSQAGGSFDAKDSVLAKGGTIDGQIYYDFQSAQFSRITVCCPYINIIDYVGTSAALSEAIRFNADNPLVVENLVGIKVYNPRLLGGVNQGAQHEGTAFTISTEFYNFYAENYADEGISTHGAVTCKVYGGAIRNCRSGINWNGAGVLRFYDMWIGETSAGYQPIDPPSPTEDVAMDLVVSGCCLVYNSADSGWQMEFELGSVEISNNLVFGINNTYWAVFRPTMTAAICTGNTFVGGVTPRLKEIIFNGLDVGGDYSNNIFYNGFFGTVAECFEFAEYGDLTGNLLKSTLTIVSGSWPNMILKWPPIAPLLAADDGTLFNAGVPNEIDMATFVDLAWMRAGSRGAAIWDHDLSATDQAKADKYLR